MILIYGVLAYVAFLGTFLYAVGFVGDLLVPKAIDDGVEISLTAAILINTLLLGLFGVQHSVMARPWFKGRWTKIIPQAAERSTFVWATCVVFALLFWQWQPITTVIWEVESSVGVAVLNMLFWAGMGLALVSTFIIDHFELFGLKQVWYRFREKESPKQDFKLASLYKVVRHPLMLGFTIAFWSTPTMTGGHLLFAGVTTVYVLVAIQIEERDLVTAHGEDYREYQRKVPMIIPLSNLGGRSN
jgi:protein-S-isoprenylcysteine O-methyltransferase Ste14